MTDDHALPLSASSTPAPAPDATPPETPKGPSFAELGLHPDVLRALDEMGSRVEEMIRVCHGGPRTAVVDRVETEPAEDDGGAGFRQLHTE